jgi:hypothetical protein
MSRVRLYGGTSGFVELAAPDVADDGVLTLPTAAEGFVVPSQLPAGIGSKVVQAQLNGAFTSTSTTYEDVTGWTATITPSTATAKILVLVDIKYAQTLNNNAVHVRLVRGGTSIYDRGTVGSRVASSVSGTGAWSTAGYGTNATTLIKLDSPETTSPVTYGVQIRIGTAGTAVINSFGTDADNATIGLYPSTITVIEVEA